MAGQDRQGNAAQFVQQIRDKAKEKGVSIRAACIEADVSESTFWRWEQDPPETLQKLAQLDAAIDRLADAQT